MNDALRIGGRDLSCRLFLGTGKFTSYELIPEVIRASGAQVVTVALRRMDFDTPQENMVKYLPSGVTLMTNTSGARNAAEAVRIAHLARAAGCGDWVKIEVVTDHKYLLPDNYETIKATEILAAEEFVVLPYMSPDREAGATFIVNDHPDLAMMVDADGVHLGQEDYPIEAVRQLVGKEMIIGVSTHSPLQAEDAIRRGADYIGVGPLFRTTTKKNVREPVGLDYLGYAVSSVSIPFVAIGGIKVHNVSEVRRRGARCIALVTEIVGASDIRRMISEILAALKEGEAESK